MSKPLGISLGIDFAKFDRDLNTLADKIEGVGKSVQVKLGGGGGVDTGQLAGVIDQLGPRLGQVGVQISQGIANGIRSASSAMMGFTGQINAMLDRLTGAAITMFHRIDSAIKFPMWDSFFRTAQLKITNFAAFWRKPLSDIDLATSGAFGGLVQKIAVIFKGLADQLAVAIADGVKRGVGTGEAAVSGLMSSTSQKAASPQRFPMGAAGLATSVPGPRIGAAAGLQGPAPAGPKMMFGHELKAVEGETKDFVRGMDMAINGILRLGSSLLVLPAKGASAFFSLRNFASSFGDVAKKTYTDIYGAQAKVVEGSKQQQAALMATNGTMQMFGNTATAVGGKLLAAFGVVGVLYKIVQFFKDGVQGAAALNETVAVGKGVFGDSFGAVRAQADMVSKRFGVMRNEQLRVAEGFGVMAQGAGYTEKASAELANRMTALTLNFAAEWQIPFSEAAEKVKAGLGGQGRELKKYGVYLDDATVKGVALAQGARLVGGELTKQDAVAARTAIVMRGLAYTTGAMERTSGGAAAQFKKAGGGIGEFGVRIGELLMPAVDVAIAGFNDLLASVLGVVEFASPAITGFIAVVTGGFQIVGGAAAQVGSILKTEVANVITAMMPSITRWGGTFTAAVDTVKLVAANLGTVWKIVELEVGAFVENSIRRIGTLPENFGRISAWIGRNWLNLIVDLGNMLRIGFNNMITNVATIGVALWEAMNSNWFRRNWYNMLVDLGTMLSSAFSNLLANAANFGKAFLSAIKGQGFKFEWTSLLDGFKSTTEKMPELLKENFKWKPVLDGFKATTEKLPDMIKPSLVSVDDEVKKLWAGMKPPPGVKDPLAPKKPGPIDEAGKTPEYKLAKAVEVGSKEASSIVARTQSGQRGDAGKQTVSLLGQSVQIQKDLLQEQRKKVKEFKVA